MEMFRGTIKETQSSGKILPVVFCGCETWSHIEPHRWREFENRVMRKTFGTKRDDVIVQWKGQHNAEHNVLYSSPNIVRVIKSRTMRCLGHIARMEREEVHTGFWWGNLTETGHLGE